MIRTIVLWLTVVLTVSSLLPLSAASGSFPQEFRWDATLFLPSGSSNASISVPSNVVSRNSTVQLSVETPFVSSSGPSNPHVSSPSLGINWGFDGPYGYSVVNASGEPLQANNGTALANLTLPVGATMVGGSGLVHAQGPPLQGNYQVSAEVGSSVVLTRNGSQRYLPFTPIPWITPTSTITAAVVGNLGYSEQFVAVGTANGSLILYRQTPGLNGSEFFQTQLETDSPVTTLSETNSLVPGTVDFLSTSWFSVFITVIESNGSSTTASPELLEGLSGILPSVIGTVGIRFPNGTMAVLAATADGYLQVANGSLSGTGRTWPDWFSLLTRVPGGITSFAGTPGGMGTEYLGVGSPGQVRVYELTQSNFSEVVSVPLPSNATPTSMVGSVYPAGFLVGSSNGWVYSLPESNWTLQPSFVEPSSQSITHLALSNSTFGGEALVVGGNGLGSVLLSPFTRNYQNVSLGDLPTSSATAFAGFGDVSGSGGDDLVLAGGIGFWVAPSEQYFSSLGIPSWVAAVKSAAGSAVHHVDNWGNTVASVPVSLTTQGGNVVLDPAIIYYNFSQTKDYAPVVLKSTSPSLNFTIDLTASSPGYLHVSLQISPPPQPVPPSPISILVNEQVLELVVLTTLAAGTILFALGQRRYLARLPDWLPKHVDPRPRREGRRNP